MDTIHEIWAWAQTHKKASIAIVVVAVLLVIAAF